MQNFLSGDVGIAYFDTAADGGESGPAPSGPPILLIHGFASNHRVNWLDTGWLRPLQAAGRRVIAIDNRGHGDSEKLYSPEAYTAPIMADDAAALLDHLDIESADLLGYSMGARIAAFVAIRHRERVRSAVFGGLGENMVKGIGGGDRIAAALEAPALSDVSDRTSRMFRQFAERTGSDLKALAACMRATRVRISAEDVGGISAPVLIAVGADDEVSGPAEPLAELIPRAKTLTMPGRDHMSAVGAKEFKAGVTEFLEAQG